MAKKTKNSNLSIEERLEQSLIPNWDEPYKLPENWCWTTIKQVAEIVTGGTPSKKNPEYYGESFPFFKPADLDAGRSVRVASEYLSEKGKAVARIIPAKSTAVCCIGSIGKSGYLEVDGTTNQQINSAIPKINPLYLYYYVNTDFFTNQLWQKSSATTISIVNKSKMEECTFPLCPTDEQQRIVDRIETLFAKLDEAKEKAQEVVDGFETRKAAILHKAFSGEFCTIDSSSNLDELLSDIFSYRENLIKSKVIQRAKLKAMEDKDIISSFPSSWKQLKLGEISFVTKLAGFEYTKYIKLEESGDIPVVRAQNVRKGYLDTNNLLYIDRQTSENLSRSALDKASILITFIGAGIGDVCVFDKPQRFHLAPNVAKVEPFCDENGAINIKFLLYYLLSPSGQKEIFKSMKAVAQPSLSMETIRDIVIPFASREEQDEIVRVVENLIIKEQNAKETAEAVIEQIETMKKAILARAFRGELGTNDPSEESALELLKSVLMGNTNQQEPQKSSKKSISIPNHIETALLTKLEKKIVSLFYTTERKVVSVDEIMSVSSKKIDIIDTLTKLEQRGILIRLNNSCYRIKE